MSVKVQNFTGVDPLQVDERYHRLRRIQSEWKLLGFEAQAAIAEEIHSHPEWGIVITDNGPVAIPDK